MKHIITLIAVLSFFSVPSVSYADWQVTGKVVAVEATWVPEKVLFQIDNGMGNCIQWPWFFYQANLGGQIDQPGAVRAAYDGLVAALYTGKKVKVVGNGCDIVNVQFTNQ